MLLGYCPISSFPDREDLLVLIAKGSDGEYSGRLLSMHAARDQSKRAAT